MSFDLPAPIQRPRAPDATSSFRLPSLRAILQEIDARTERIPTRLNEFGYDSFGLGGVLALEAGARNRRILCVVDFYGVPDAESTEDALQLDVPALLIFGEEDAQVLDGAARNLEARLTTARLKVEPGAGFGFMNEAHADLHAATAAAAGWEAAIAFLGASL